MESYSKEQIEYYEENYRNGNAVISDVQFDKLEKSY